MKRHLFTLVVQTYANRKTAERDVLLAFSTRKPDGCRFYLRRTKPKKPKGNTE